MSAAGRALAAAAVLLGCDVSRPVRVIPTPACPTFQPFRWVDTDCDPALLTSAWAQDGCSVTVTLTDEAHPLGARRVFAGELDAQGHWAIAPSSPDEVCREVAPRTGAVRRIECERPTTPCGYDLIPDTPPAAPAVLRAAIVPAAPALPDGLGPGDGPLDDQRPRMGYLASMVLTANAAWVATFDGRFEDERCQGPSTLVRVRGVDGALAVDAPVAAPDCLRELARDPQDPTGFWGVTSGERPTLLRFDGEGRTVASSTLAFPESRDARRPVVPVALSVTAGAAVLVVSTLEEDLESWLLELDPRTLRLRSTSHPAPNPVRAATPVVGDRVYAADVWAGQVVPFHVGDPSIDQPFSINLIGGDSDDAGAIGVMSSASRVLVASTGALPLLYLIDAPRASALGAWRFYERDAAPWASASTPAGDDAWVGLTERDPPYRAYLARASLLERRFLPGATPIGTGVVRAIAVDAQGDAWVLLPWTAELLRVRYGAGP